MKKTFNWGVLGWGKIAKKFASDLSLVEGARLYAIASRSLDKNSLTEFNPAFVFNTYEELVSCGEVDVIYVATPHGFHFEHVMLCLNHGKAVLCEKALALNQHQVRQMVEKAREKKVFLMEAFWTKFLPQFDKVRELIATGSIGDIQSVQADFGFRASDPPAQRLYDPLLGGGSLLDIGIYPVFLAITLLGLPTSISAHMTPYSTGVDEQCAIVFRHESGALSTLLSTFKCDTPVEAVISGTEGRIRLSNRFHNATSRIELIVGKQDPVEIPVHRESGFGYQFEARHVQYCLGNQWTESPVMSHQNSLDLMATLDAIRAICGIRYAVDEPA